MRFVAVLLLTLSACAGRTVPGSVYFKAVPRIQSIMTNKPACFDLTVLGPMPEPAVLEILEENVYGMMETVHRSVWNGERQRQACGPGWDDDYFIQRSRAHEYDQLRRLEGVTQGGQQPAISGEKEWDGSVAVQFILRAPRPEDFDGVMSKDKLESEFGRFDGAVYRTTVVRVQLSCNCSY